MCFLSKSVLLLSNNNNNMCAAAVWRKTEKTKVEIFIIGVSEEEKEERFLKKKTKKGFNALIFEFVERALKSFSVIAPWRQLLRLFLRPLFVS
jgi:hypothetical protein